LVNVINFLIFFILGKAMVKTSNSAIFINEEDQ
jgi:hypothetical protein